MASSGQPSSSSSFCSRSFLHPCCPVLRRIFSQKIKSLSLTARCFCSTLSGCYLSLQVHAFIFCYPSIISPHPINSTKSCCPLSLHCNSSNTFTKPLTVRFALSTDFAAMAYIQSPASDASSDLYAEVDTSSQLNLTSRSRLQVVSQASDPTYDDNSVPLPAQTKGKRRFGGEDHILDSQKRRKIVLTPERYFSPAIPPVANLPAEVWQHVFLYLTPDDLSRCLRVNRLFHSYLTDLTGSMSIRLPFRRNGLKLIDSEAIWTSARKLFAPNLPRPLAGFTEMHMFQLLGGSDCQACGVFPQQQIQPSTPFDAGPGPGGVRIIWSFSARLCSECFRLYSVKVVLCHCFPRR